MLVRNNTFVQAGLILILASIGFMGVILSSSQGIGISPDSAVYIAGARSLEQGDGFQLIRTNGESSPITRFPPLYSIILAVPGLIGVDPIKAAPLINASLFAINIALIGLLVRRAVGHSKQTFFQFSVPILASALFLFSPQLVILHLMAWSEGLFLMLTMLTIGVLAAYLDNPTWRKIILAAVLTGLAIITRYIGFSLFGAAVILLLLFGNNSRTINFRDIGLFLVIGLLPLAAWLIIAEQGAGSMGGRSISFHPVTIDHARQALSTVAGWFQIPASSSGFLKIIPIVLLLIGFGWILVREWLSTDRAASREFVPWGFFLFSISYLGILMISVSFLDANTPFDDRILSPILVAVIVLGIYSVYQLSKDRADLIGSVVLILIILLILAPNLITAYRTMNDARSNGLGLNGSFWRQSDLIGEVEKLPENVPLYSNAPEAIYVQTGRPTDTFPRKIDRMSQRWNLHYEDELVDFGQSLREGSGLIVYFKGLDRESLPNETELNATFDLIEIIVTSDGKIYQPR